MNTELRLLSCFWYNFLFYVRYQQLRVLLEEFLPGSWIMSCASCMLNEDTERGLPPIKGTESLSLFFFVSLITASSSSSSSSFFTLETLVVDATVL